MDSGEFWPEDVEAVRPGVDLDATAMECEVPVVDFRAELCWQSHEWRRWLQGDSIGRHRSVVHVGWGGFIH